MKKFIERLHRLDRGDMSGLIRTTILTVALAFGAVVILAQDLQKGWAASKSGDYAAALK